MKILWTSNAPWAHTGYAGQTRQVVPRIADTGHEVAIAANYGVNGDTMTWTSGDRDFLVYPSGLADYSNDVIPAHAEDWFKAEPGWLITLYDVWALRAKQYEDFNVAAWCPIDHMPAPPAVQKWFQDYGAVPIAMSKFGRDQLTKSGFEPLYAPHGIDTTIFRPHDKETAKTRLGLDPEKFIVGMVAANHGRSPSRKAFAEAFAAYSFFHADHPDSLLYVHSDMYGHAEGLELDVLASACGIPPDGLIFADQYGYRRGFPDEMMAWLYSAFDVLLFPSMGEGFGIPSIEAQACGTPVIVSNFSAQAELVAPDTGWRVPCQPWWDGAQKSFFVIPLIEGIGNALEAAYSDRAALAAAAFACREFALDYDCDRVFSEHWLPILDYLEERLPTTAPIVADPV